MIRGAQGLVESTPAEALLGSRHHHLYPCHQLASFPKQIAAVGQETDHCGGGGGLFIATNSSIAHFLPTWQVCFLSGFGEGSGGAV